jgi:hypothetical protein
MPNMASGSLENLFVVVHNACAPSAEEWEHYMSITRDSDRKKAGDFSQVGHIVFTDGGGPNAVQRAKTDKVLLGRTVRCAVVTKSSLVRGIVTTLSWVNPEICVFSPNAWREAFHHVYVGREQYARAWELIFKLRRQVGDIAAIQEAFSRGFR